jgi:hypothetical protein
VGQVIHKIVYLEMKIIGKSERNLKQKNVQSLGISQLCISWVLTNRVLCIMEAEMKDRSDDSSKQKVVMRNAVAMSRKNSTCVIYIGFAR